MTVTWGEWMGSWKQLDEEAERLDRQRAAFGGDTLARIKDLNVLIVGMGGVGVETAKNLILSNVGAVVMIDSKVCEMPDMGSNFYISANDVEEKKTRAEASLPKLKTLNPYCKVDVSNDLTKEHLTRTNVLATGKPFAAIVVTQLLPKRLLLELNETARQHNIAFVLAVTSGVTTSIFSDFGPHHEITDANGEPTQMLAISNIEVLQEKPDLLKIDSIDKGPLVVLTVAQSEHGLDDNDVVAFDDMRNELAFLNGKQFKVKRVAFQSPTDAKVNAQSVIFQEALKQPTSAVLKNFEKQYAYYKSIAPQDKKFGVRTITMFNRLALVLDESTNVDAFQSYQAGGLLNQVRPPIVKQYKSLHETLVKTPVPQMLRGEHWEDGKGIEVHLSIAAALEFEEKHDRWPAIHNDKDESAFLEICKDISSRNSQEEGACWSQSVSFGFPSGEARDLDDTRLGRFAKLFQTELSGFCAFLGGAAAQEVLKKTGKFTPISQWVHHDEHVLVTDESRSNVLPLFGSRYDHQIAVMGKSFMQHAANAQVFLVGCGALGCEYLKGMALMGVGTGQKGHVYVTDMDRIEVSNLSRQFLFRDADVGHPKSVSGARVVKEWNSQMNITALEEKVGPDTEDFFSDNFWQSLTVCWNALDNVVARRYTDAQCLFHSKPLLESGTLGTKCNHEVILPYRTATYNDGKESDENENQIAMCTLRSFPYLPLHCIEFAKQAYFSDYFEFGPDQYETYRKDMSSFFEQLDSMDEGEQLKSLEMISFFIVLQKSGAIGFGACVRIAFDRMLEDFRTSVLNLCHAADEMEKSDGKKFWTGTKRRPRAIEWTAAEEVMPELMEYLYCTSNLYAVVWGLDPVRDRDEFQKVVSDLGLQQPEWTPSSKQVDLSEDDNEMGGVGQDVTEKVEKIKADLYSVNLAELQEAHPHDFEKDDDANFHIDFLTVATNLRAWNYDIKASQRHTVKVTSGRIIPALATTTAMVCGLVDIEFCKLVMGLECKGRDVFLNSNINLAAGSGNFTTYSPDPPVSLKTGLSSPYPTNFTSWDKIEVTCDPQQEWSVEHLVKYIQSSLGVTVDRVFEFGSKADKAIYNAVDEKKLSWDITMKDGIAKVSDGVYVQWPQIRMAVQMLNRLPPTSGQRKVFEGQVSNVKRALDKTKSSFMDTFQGPVSQAYYGAYEPSEQKDKDYFDAVFGGRNYLKLGVHCHTETEEDVHLPCIKYVYAEYSDSSEQALKRHKTGD